ncbi:MAG: 4Fe-4S dicluster domain-containing protein [Bilophila wadsworthia]
MRTNWKTRGTSLARSTSPASAARPVSEKRPTRWIRRRNVSFLRPPGALPESAFLKTCIHCGQCAAACPWRKRTYAGNLRAGTPHAGNQAERNPCWLCMKCPRPAPAERCGPWPP